MLKNISTTVTAMSESKIICSSRTVTCGTVLAQGETFYRCYTCQIRRMSVICVDCFQVELHQKHRYALLVAEANNYYCDCGDTATLLQSSTCPKHSVK